MDRPYFSLIIPVYNVAPYLRECLDSVLAQKFEFWEAICVDDGSADESGAILDEYVRRDVRFKKVVKRNGGLASARNAAFPFVTAPWVGCVDSDDKIEPEWLSQAKAGIEKYAPDMLRMGFKFWNPLAENGVIVWDSDQSQEEVIDGQSAVYRWGWDKWLNGGWVWRFFLRSELLFQSGVKYPERAIVKEDVIFDMDILPHLTRVAQLSYDGYRYRMRGDSLWHKPRTIEACIRFVTDMKRIWAQQENLIKEKGMNRVAKNQMEIVLGCDLYEWVDYGVTLDRNRTKELEALYVDFFKNKGILPRIGGLRFFLGLIWFRLFNNFQLLYWLASLRSALKSGIKRIRR